MKILKELDDAKLVIVDLEVKLGDKIRSAPTLCAKYKGKILLINFRALSSSKVVNTTGAITKEKNNIIPKIIAVK